MKIVNKRARHDYQILESFEAGIALTGPEVRSIKQGRGNLEPGFVRIRESEARLLGINIPFPGSGGPEGYDPLRPRKLLLHKRELVSLSAKVHRSGLTLIPLSLYTKGRLIKAQIALAKGKRQYEKKEAKKRKDIERELQRNLRG